MLWDLDNRKDMEVEYFYHKKNLQVRHNIKEPIPFDDDALREEIAGAADMAIRKLDAE